MTTKHRKCGCDCNDQTRWVEDDGITQATFDCGCEDGKKPPCVYWANFECNVKYNGADIFPTPTIQTQKNYSRGVPAHAEQLRPICKWGPVGQYVSFRAENTASLEVFTRLSISEAITNGSCTWDDVLGFGSIFSGGLGSSLAPGRLPRFWQNAEDNIRWALLIAESPVTLTHFGGATYSQKLEESWDCFGPNTLWLDRDPSEYTAYATLPTFVCVTPDVFAAKSDPSICETCYRTTIPSVSGAKVTIPSQEIEFLAGGIELGSVGYSLESPFLFKSVRDDSFSGDVFSGGRRFCSISFLDPIVSGQSSRAAMRFDIDTAAGVDGQNYAVYQCDQFRCGIENIFTLASPSANWPLTLTLTPGDCTRSDQYQWGPCWRSDGPVSWESGYPAGGSDDVRQDCCDPWCSCAPGWLKVFNPSGLYLFQEFGGLTTSPESSTAFCAGGRYGREDPGSISREWCVENVFAADGTTHTVCMVLYCGSLGGGTTWLIDWYCDGAFVATRNMNQVLNCCPNQMAQLGPEMPCLPGAVLCVGINIEPACEPPPPPCCNLSDYQSTLTLTMYTTGCSGWPSTVTLTKSGSVFSGSFSVGSDAVLVTFDCVNPVNGVSCGIKFVCSSTGVNRVGQMESTTCSPPTLTGSVGLGLTFFCGCGAISSVACVLNTP